MKKTKQILSVFLSVCMIISCMVGMSVTAGAVVSPSVSQATSNLSGDGNVTAGNFYQDFVEVSEEEAKAWTGAPAEDSFLIYKISGNDLFYIFFNNGAFDSSSFFSATIDSFNYLLTVNKMYYTTGSGSSTPATTNVSFVRAESVQDLGTNLPNIPTYTKEQAEAWIAANKAELMAEHQARLAITKDESFFIVVYSKNGSTYNHIHYRHNDPTWSSPQYRGNYTLNMYKDEMNDYGAIVYYPGVAATPSTVAVTDVSLDKTTATLTAGGDPIALTATVTPADATDKKVKWSTDSSNVKLYTSEACTTEVGTDATETLTVYAKGISAGSAIVTVTSNADSTKSATCAVTVNPALPTVTITPEGAGIIEPPVFDSDRMCWNITATPATGYSFVKWTYKFNGNPKESTKGTFYATEPCSDITAVFEVSTYDISFDNGGTAKVDGTVVTSAAEGAIVTISAPEAEPGTEFNGWTSTSEGVTFEDASKATTKFTMPANEVTISASFQNIAYKITMRNGGTAYVDGKKATTAEAGTVVTVKAGSSGTSARFNGWTTTTEGVEFADADSAETTFKMPLSDVEISASFEGVETYNPSYSSNTSTTTSSSTASSVDSASSKAKMWAVQNDDKSSITVGWEKVNGATKYTLYVRKDNGELKKVVDTKKTKVRINNPENNTTLEYVLKYTIGGVESAENSAYTASIKVYYKPAVKASSKDGAVILKWKKVEGAEKYRVYNFTNGKLVKIADTEANAVRLKNVTTGKTYKYAVKAYVDGKWTKVTSKDIVSVKVK